MNATVLWLMRLLLFLLLLLCLVNAAMVQCGGIPPGVLSAVLSVWLAPDHKYAFVEMCTSDSAAVALGLNGWFSAIISLRYF